MATAAILQRYGIPAILDMSCRDRNRIGLQSDLLAAAALGVESVCCVTGDHPALGDHHFAQPVFDIDAFELLAVARQLREHGRFENGQQLASSPEYLIGAIGNPGSQPIEWQAERTAAKVVAGADFIQTHPAADLQVFRNYVQRMTDLGVLESAWLIAGVVVATSLEQVMWLQAEVAVHMVSDDLVALLQRTAPQFRHAAAIAYAAETIAELRSIPGISGVLLFPMGEDVQVIAETVEQAGVRRPA